MLKIFCDFLQKSQQVSLALLPLASAYLFCPVSHIFPISFPAKLLIPELFLLCHDHRPASLILECFQESGDLWPLSKGSKVGPSKVIQMNLLTKQKETHKLRKWTYGCQGEGIVRDFGKVMYIRLYLKWITSKDLLYSTGNSAQCDDVPVWMGGGFGEERIHVYVWRNPFTVRLKLPQHS